MAAALTGMLLGCAPDVAPHPQALSDSYAAALADTLEAVARASEAAWGSVSCEDLSPALKYWDGSPPGLVHSSEGMMDVFTDLEWTATIRKGVCASGNGEALVDSILVTVLSPDIATASMRYHAMMRDSSGIETPRYGQILRVLRRTPDGWKIRVSMSTHLSADTLPE